MNGKRVERIPVERSTGAPSSRLVRERHEAVNAQRDPQGLSDVRKIAAVNYESDDANRYSASGESPSSDFSEVSSQAM